MENVNKNIEGNIGISDNLSEVNIGELIKIISEVLDIHEEPLLEEYKKSGDIYFKIQLSEISKIIEKMGVENYLKHFNRRNICGD